MNSKGRRIFEKGEASSSSAWTAVAAAPGKQRVQLGSTSVTVQADKTADAPPRAKEFYEATALDAVALSLLPEPLHIIL